MIDRAEYRLFFTIACFLIFKFITAQEPKPPEAVDDMAVSFQGGTVSIPVLENDIAEDGHPIAIVTAVGSPFGDVYFTDSLVIYKPFSHFIFQYPDSDTLRYMIKDLVNGLQSGFGKIALTLLPADFNFARDTLTLNNCRAPFNAAGSYFSDFYGDHLPAFEVPANSGLHTLKRSNLLIGGKVDGYVEHIAGESELPPYGYHVTDFWPGPRSDDEAYSQEQDSTWNRSWKLSAGMIQAHQENWYDPDYIIPEVIASWPGNGLVSLGQAPVLAPFGDLNTNGMYEPELGDYPIIAGDQAIFSLFNDHRTTSIATLSPKMDIEVSQLAFAFDCPEDSTFSNTVFVRYRIVNRSSKNYGGVYAGIYTAFSIGTEGDEHMGCDTILDCYFGYNAPMDEDSGASQGYGDFPPAQGVCILNHALSGFVGPMETWYNGPAPNYNILSGLWPFGEPVTLGGDGHGGSDTTAFLFSGDPSDPGQWSDYQVNPDNPGSRNGVGAAGPFTMLSGDTLDLEIAYVFARDYGGSNLSSVQLLKERIAILRWYYENDSTPCGKSWLSAPETGDGPGRISVYPNPASEYFSIDFGTQFHTPVHYSVTDMKGTQVARGILENATARILISNLSPGIYIFMLNDGKHVSMHKILKK